MTQIQLAVKLDQLIEAGPNIFLKINPEIIDFTKEVNFDLTFMAKDFEFNINVDNDNIFEVFALVNAALFENNKLFIITWNIKNLFTYCLFKTCSHVLESRILDLKLAECFIGIREKSPRNFNEMLIRLKKVVSDSSWGKFKRVFQKVYLPLITTVLPKVEIEGVFDTERKKILFPYYEIEGQVGGRLSCHLVNDYYFNPHSLSKEDKSKLFPKAHGMVFLSFDYHFHEVCVLAWLSKDTLLESLVSGEGDFYRKLYKELTGSECDTDVKRSFCKDYLFLPVVYGQSSRTLADRAKINITVAERLIDKLHNIFPTLFNWLESYVLEDGLCTDYIGRKRKFIDGEEYKYRNFLIQSPGAIFCLEKLVAIDRVLEAYGNIVAHIHDGYVIRCLENHAEMVKIIVSKAMEGDSELFPGLRLKTDCKISKSLA